MEVAGIFRDVLLGVQVLHNHGWLHGDLKPSNIGVMGTPLRAVILDTGSAMYLEPGSTLKPEPESGGTLDYIAPEREMDEYDHSVDIWSLGCIGYELTYGEHPWSLSVNPWRDDSNQSLGSGRDYYGLFEQKYEEAMDELSQDFSVFRSRTPQDGDFLHREFPGIVACGIISTWPRVALTWGTFPQWVVCCSKCLGFPGIRTTTSRGSSSTRLFNTMLGDRCCLTSDKSSGIGVMSRQGRSRIDRKQRLLRK